MILQILKKLLLAAWITYIALITLAYIVAEGKIDAKEELLATLQKDQQTLQAYEKKMDRLDRQIALTGASLDSCIGNLELTPHKASLFVEENPDFLDSGEPEKGNETGKAAKTPPKGGAK